MMFAERDSALLILSAAFAASTLSAIRAGEAETSPGGLRRGGYWGFRLSVKAATPGAEVRALDPASPAASAGLRASDRVLAMDDTPIRDEAALRSALRARRAGDLVRLQIARGEAQETIRFRLPALPQEAIPGCEITYASVRSPQGYRVRTIVSRPAGARGRLPAILFVPWLSCDAVEAPLGPTDGWSKLLHGLAARSGWVLMRVEKPGVGDSEGPDCSRNDLETDLAAFRTGLAQLRELDFVDPSRIVLFGGSIGGALAPLLALEQPVAGLIVAGAFSRTWFEHMLEIERERLILAGRSPGDVNRALQGFAEFYTLYLGQRLTPAQALAKRPELTPLWYDAPDGQYGRPAAYFHQVAQLNVEDAWSRLDVPVLVLYGEYDWIMSRAEHERIVDIVNARRPGLAELVVLSRTDHNLEVFESREDAFRGDGGRFDDGLVDRVGRWLNARAN